MTNSSFTFQDCNRSPDPYDYNNITPTFYVLDETQESVCSGDDRRKVTATTALPYMAICKLYMKAKNGLNLIGTGWLSHRNKLYTAGHCVYDSNYGGWMDSIEVVPAQAGRKKPYGSYAAIEMMATKDWINKRSKRFDMGAIKLARQVSHSRVLIPTLADANEANVCGYPGDRDRGLFQFSMRDAIRKHGGRFFYQIDTFGGQSGAPLLQRSSQAIGIHNYGGCDNSGSDLYGDFVDAIENW